MNGNSEDIRDMFNTVVVPPELDLTIEKAIQEGKRHNRRSKVLARAAVAASMALVIGVTAIGLRMFGGEGKTPQYASGTNGEKKLPVVASLQNLTELLKDTKSYWAMYDMYENGMSISEDKATGTTNGAPGMGNLKAEKGTGSDYSSTNVQVEGVDEGDIVKTDGEYIYRVKGYGGRGTDNIEIVKINDGKAMKVVSKLEYPGVYFSQIYITDKYMAAIGIKSNPGHVIIGSKNGGTLYSERQQFPYSMPSSILIVYDITDRANVKVLREVETEGNFSDSRMIEGNIYMISNKGIPYYILQNGMDADELKPSYRDSVVGKDFNYIGYKDIWYCPEAVDSNYIMVTSVNLNKPLEKAKVTSTLGSAANIYCSTDNLYVAGYNYSSKEALDGRDTAVYKFNLKGGEVIYKSSGKVPGAVLNQFSMDESNGYFRIATTIENYTQGKDKQLNNLYVFDSNMKLTGSLENLAKGERIYSVRFLGDRAYMVTFRTTDPLFVIDLKNPSAPRVLGELKIPGYSNYLHPYDENHIIGFGKDAEVVEQGTSSERAYYQGMKLAIFDVTDVNNPKEMFKTGIGGRGTDSDILYDHKALLFSRDKGLLAFPVQVAEVRDKDNLKKSAYGELTFSGAYVYHIDLKSGFTLQGKITHGGITRNSDGDMVGYDYSKRISRILYIDDKLYTLSEGVIKTNSLKDLSEVGSLTTH